MGSGTGHGPGIGHGHGHGHGQGQYTHRGRLAWSSASPSPSCWLRSSAPRSRAAWPCWRTCADRCRRPVNLPGRGDPVDACRHGHRDVGLPPDRGSGGGRAGGRPSRGGRLHPRRGCAPARRPGEIASTGVPCSSGFAHTCAGPPSWCSWRRTSRRSACGSATASQGPAARRRARSRTRIRRR